MRISPTSRLASTSPATIRSAASTPTILAIAGLLALKPGQLVQPVERCRLVALGERRIIENSVHEVIYRSFENEHGLADVQQLGSAFANDVNSQQLLGLAMKDELQ